MSKFANKTFGNTSSESTGTKTDWTALNTHVSEAVQEAIGCEESTPASAIGIISGIVDFGKHQDPERVEPLVQAGDERGNKWRENQVAKGKATVVDGMFHYQARECQEVGFFVDFPSIIVDKGQFFGESNPAPYRVFLGGDYDHKPSSTKVEGYPNKSNVWVFGDSSRATTLAKAAGLKDLKEGFAQSRLLELIGKPLMFSVETYINAKGYLTEKVTKPTRLMAGIPVPEYNEDLLFYVGMHDTDNEDAHVMMVPKAKSVKSYMQSALDYKGSSLEAQFIRLEGEPEKEEAKEQTAPKQEQTVAKEIPVQEDETDFDQDVPF